MSEEVVQRPEIYREPLSQKQFGIVEKPLSAFERIYDLSWLRKLFVLVVIAALWEGYARWLDNELLVPTFSATVDALIDVAVSGVIFTRAAMSLKVLLMGFSIGVLVAALLTIFAINTRIGNDFLETMTAMFNPLPAIALLPAGADLVRARGQPGVRAGPFGALGGGAQYSCRFSRGLHHASHGRAELWSARPGFRRKNPDPGGIPEHPCRPQDRLGFCLAHLDRRRTGVWDDLRSGRARVVHFRGQEPAQHSGSLRRAPVHYSDRAICRERRFQADRGEDRATLGHAELGSGPINLD